VPNQLESMTVQEPLSYRIVVLYVDGPLCAPVNTSLRHAVGALLRRGERRIVLNLARVSSVDAAGIGEVVRAYNKAIAMNGVLRIADVPKRLEELLDRVGLFALLSGSPEIDGTNVA
jgi:anti-sigma B factor antagonist